MRLILQDAVDIYMLFEVCFVFNVKIDNKYESEKEEIWSVYLSWTGRMVRPSQRFDADNPE